jgi:phosphoribosyl 1,2-cyclic phosphate phosphodiesterase
MQAKITMLGSGGSMGVPVVGCSCAVCTSSNPYNKRLRPSIAIEMGEKILLVDCGPDFREQAIAADIKHVDALLLTHTHFDHIAGLDDLRIFGIRSRVLTPCYLSMSSYIDLQKRYYYLFEKEDDSIVRLKFHKLEKERGDFHPLDIPMRYFTYSQNGMSVLGYRLGNFAYVTDIKQYTEAIFEDLRGVEYLIISMQKKEKSNAHLSLEELLSFHAKIKPRHCYITHMGHDIDYDDLKNSLPVSVEPGYDGLSFWINPLD